MSNYVGYARQVYPIYSRFYIHLFYLYTCIYSNSVFRRCVVDGHNVVGESPSDSSPFSAYIPLHHKTVNVPISKLYILTVIVVE